MEGKRFIHKIKLQNFLSYGSDGEEIELQPLNVLIGASTSGKSNLIEAIGILKATPTNLPAPFRQGGGINQFLWKGNKVLEVKLLQVRKLQAVSVKDLINFFKS
ncbi:MAG: AAA family ATPase [Aphanizomenon gracile PMC627.10]|nr:AAA family ATPase [Aphanizomenon gracile PMC627.10]